MQKQPFSSKFRFNTGAFIFNSFYFFWKGKYGIGLGICFIQTAVFAIGCFNNVNYLDTLFWAYVPLRVAGGLFGCKLIYRKNGLDRQENETLRKKLLLNFIFILGSFAGLYAVLMYGANMRYKAFISLINTSYVQMIEKEKQCLEYGYEMEEAPKVFATEYISLLDLLDKTLHQKYGLSLSQVWTTYSSQPYIHQLARYQLENTQKLMRQKATTPEEKAQAEDMAAVCRVEDQLMAVFYRSKLFRDMIMREVEKTGMFLPKENN